MAMIGMGERLIGAGHFRFSESDLVRAVVILSLVFSITVITAISLSRSYGIVSYQLFFIPILYATYFYAKRGLIVAGICGIIYQALGYYFRYPDPAALMGVTSEAFLFVIIAYLITYCIEQIRSGEARYRTVFEHSQLGIMLFDKNTLLIKQTNEKILQMLHYTSEEIARAAFPLLFFSEEEKELFLLRVKEHMNAENFETRFRTKEGDICWVNLSWSAIDDQTVSVTVVNIHERKQIEKANADTMMRYQQLTENSPTSIIVLQAGRVRFANPSFSHFSGYSPAELEGKDLLFFLDQTDYEKFGNLHLRLVSESAITDGTEFRFVTKNGEKRVAALFANPIVHDNHPATMINLVDISVQQRLEEKIQQDNERRRGIIITVAHELRTPLQPILGYLNMLIQDPAGFGIIDDTKKMLERCLVSVERERQIINQMLELSVLESGKLQLSFSDFSLRTLVQNVLDTGGYLSRAEVTVDVPPDLIISADMDRLFSVLDSLLSNAVNYSKPPRRISIVYLPGADGSSHTIAVKDNGIGIPENMLASIFEPFQLADAAKLSRKYDRMGLSLSIAKKILQMHGGDITVQSIVNTGSTFTLIIPKVKTHAA